MFFVDCIEPCEASSSHLLHIYFVYLGHPRGVLVQRYLAEDTGKARCFKTGARFAFAGSMVQLCGSGSSPDELIDQVAVHHRFLERDYW